MVERDGNGARQAALLLYGLSTEARRAVMSNLSAHEAAAVQSLLNELTAMRVPRQVARELYRPPTTPPVSGPPLPGLHAQVEQLSVERAERSVCACDPMTVAYLLNIREWSWKAQVLDRMAPNRRLDVLRHLRGNLPPLAPAAQRTLLEALCARAGED